MKIFATSDTHDDGIILRKLKELSEENKFDYIFHCGDIGGKSKNTRSLSEFGEYQKEGFDFLMKQHPENLRYILGNDDWFEAKTIDYLMQDTYSNFENIIGFEYVHITPFNTNREANENKIEYELNKLEVNNSTVIVAHDVPFNCLDNTYRGENVGSRSIRKFIEVNQPKLWLSGHIHESFGVSSIGDTGVFNCACSPEKHLLRGWIIDLDSLDYEKVVI